MKKTLLLITLAVILGGGYFALKNNIESQIKPEVDKAVANLHAQGIDAAYADMNVNPVSRSAALDQVSLKSPDADLKIDQIVIFASDDYEKRGRFQAIGCNIKRQDLGASLRDIQGLPETVKADAEVDYALGSDGKSLDLKLLSLALRDLGQIELRLSISDVPLDAVRQSPLTLLFAYPQIVIHSASLKYQDGGLLELVMRNEAKMKGITPEALLAQAEADIENKLALAKVQNNTFVEEYLKALKTFLKDRKGLQIAIAPPAPVKIADVMNNPDPDAAAKALNLRAESL